MNRVRQALFRQAEIDAHGAQVLQHGDDGAGLHITGPDRPAGGRWCRRRARSPRAAPQRPRRGPPAACAALEGRLRGVEPWRWSVSAAALQFPLPRQVRALQLQLGARGLQIGALHHIVEADQQLPGVHLGVRLEQDLAQDAGRFDREVDTPGLALTVPMAFRTGCQVTGCASTVSTGRGCTGMSAKICSIIWSRNRLKPTRPPPGGGAAPDQTQKQNRDDETF